MPIEMPTSPGFVTSRFTLETNTQRFESPLTKSVQRILLAGARWTATFSLPAMNRAQAAYWKAFFLLLEGSANTFNGFDPDSKTSRGAASTNPGTPLVNGGSQTGSSLIIDGAPHSINNWLMPADMFAVNGELKMITAPVNTDGSGNATIQFKPALRSSPADNAVITIQKPTCTMALADDMQTTWECDKNGIYQSKTFTALEVFV